MPRKKAAAAVSERPVLVTTAHRGVFYGFTTEPSDSIIERKIVALRAARCVGYWPVENKGFLGLASMGPKKGARVGPPADITINDVTCVAECAADTADLWEAYPWSQ